PEWGPWSAGGYRGTARHAPGAVYWLRSASRFYGRHATSVERIEEIDEGRRIVYTVLGGTPVRHYRGEVTLTAVPGGTRANSAAGADRTMLGGLVWREQRTFFPVRRESLTTAATAASRAASP